MQYKKKEINDRILDAGKQEYAAKGYRAGNISDIAEKAGVPVGNLYRYFDGKAGLLDAIVMPAYSQVPKLLSELQKVQVIDSLTLENIMPLIVEQLLVFFDRFSKEILILVDNCATTRYEDFATDITNQVSEVVEKKLYENPSDMEKRMAQSISKAFLNSLFDLLRLGLNREDMQKMMFKLIKFYFYEVNSRK